MAYIDAIEDTKHNCIHIVERVNGKREYKEYPLLYKFYYDDRQGKRKSIYGTSVTECVAKSKKEFEKELRIHGHKQLFESDIKPIFRCLEENYKNQNAPELHTAFFDIEVDFDKDKGFSKPDDPFNPITAITIYLSWLQKLITLVIPPSSMSIETAKEIVVNFDNTILCRNETEMLESFLDVIADADILSGWNSEGFDIPYVVNRIQRIMSKDDTKRLCLWNKYPKVRTFERYGAKQTTFDLVGRIHLDYMQLYRKYTYEERHSYSLDSIAEYELGEQKTQFEGTLDQLYHQNFKTFIEYNRQDTLLLVKMDAKLKLISLVNELAHANTVLLPTTMGAVAVTEQAIINETHERGMVVPNRKYKSQSHTDFDDDFDDSVDEANQQVAGAYVAYPKKGLHKFIGAIDINSLYPSAIRALNMAPETVIGQLRPTLTDNYIANRLADGHSFAKAWEGLFASLEYTAVMEQQIGTEITIDWESGDSITYSAAQVWQLIFNKNNPWMLTANGTIFTFEKEGIIPGLLARWYSERKKMQQTMKECTDPKEREFWDKRQLIKKINLNSLYGAILNPGCRFFDARIGQSTTLIGRSIAKHMGGFVNETITGDYDNLGKAIIYGDTDSVYFSAWSSIKDDVAAGTLMWDKDLCSQLYTTIAEKLNESFPAFMERSFHCPRERGSIIKGGCESISTTGLFITKKRYAINVFNSDGDRKDKNGKTGVIKAKGLDLKRSDTPKVIQDFLWNLLERVLNEADKNEIVDAIKDFKLQFAARPGWEKGTPKRVNNLTAYTEKLNSEKPGKVNIPGHVRAAINWNIYRKMNSDNYSMQIVDGMKIIVCKLKGNPLGWTSIGYPTDAQSLPKWFRELPFDDNTMESTIVDQKIKNLLGILDWDLEELTVISNTFQSLFDSTDVVTVNDVVPRGSVTPKLGKSTGSTFRSLFEIE